MARFKLKVATLELEKLGASVNVDKGKDGKEIATVNILKKWTGDKDAMQLLKNVPNLQVVHIDSNQVNDTALAPLKELAGFSADDHEPPGHRRRAQEPEELERTHHVVPTGSKVGDKGLVQCKNLQVPALSRTEVTDAGLDALKDLKSLKSIYLIGTKVTPQAIGWGRSVVRGVRVSVRASLPHPTRSGGFLALCRLIVYK